MTSEARAKAWATRRAKYGAQGHAGLPSSYVRKATASGANPETMLRFILRMHREGTISEGQASRATGLNRITIRTLADEARNNSNAEGGTDAATK